MTRPRKWDKDSIARAYGQFNSTYGHIPTWRDICAPKLPWMPHWTAVRREYGTHGNACVEIFGHANYRGQNQERDKDTLVVMQRLREGASLAELGRERGITGQALGRRVRRYRKMHGIPEPLKPGMVRR